MENNRLHHFWSLTKLPSVDGEKEKKNKQTKNLREIQNIIKKMGDNE